MAVTHRINHTITADDLLEWADDDQGYELIEGELIPVSPVVGSSGRLENEVSWIVTDHVKRHKLGVVYSPSTGFRLRRDPDTVLAPDVSFIRAERVPSGEDEEHFIDVAPDLVIEILSPSNRAGAMNAKVLAYLEAGTLLIWVMDPMRQSVTVWSSDLTARILTVDDTLDSAEVLPGFSMRVGDILPAPPATRPQSDSTSR